VKDNHVGCQKTSTEVAKYLKLNWVGCCQNVVGKVTGVVAAVEKP